MLESKHSQNTNSSIQNNKRPPQTKSIFFLTSYCGKKNNTKLTQYAFLGLKSHPEICHMKKKISSEMELASSYTLFTLLNTVYTV